MLIEERGMRKGIASVGCALLGVGLAAGLAAEVSGAASAADATARAATVTMSAGAWRTLPTGYFGINYDYGGASVYVTDGHVAQQVAALGPGTLRWSAGTGANYFQWQKGYPVAALPASGTGSCAPPKEQETDGFRFTLADLAAAYRRSGATPVFDLNVMTATLPSQIAMLRTARQQYGLPVKYVELGNEFYLCNTDYVKAFPTARAYGATVAADVKALHHAFPGVQVAAVGAIPETAARTHSWTADVLRAAVARGGKPDAVTLHTHPEFNQSLTAAGLPALFAEPYSSASTVAAQTKQFPGTPAWITEYGLSLHWTSGNAPQLTYANALFADEAALLLAQKASAATRIDYWSSFGPSVNYAYTSAGLSAVGLAAEWLGQVVHGASAEAAITFSGGPVLGTTGRSALVGESFRVPGGHRVLLINLSGQTVTLGTGAVIARGVAYRQVTGSPTRKYAAATGLRISTGSVAKSIRLTPYSITAIGG
jgi:hypothetical protein